MKLWRKKFIEDSFSDGKNVGDWHHLKLDELMRQKFRVMSDLEYCCLYEGQHSAHMWQKYVWKIRLIEIHINRNTHRSSHYYRC